MNRYTKKCLKALEQLGWSATVGNDEIQLENYSPAGEDLIIILDTSKDAPNIETQLWSNYDDFDEDYHVEMWAEARRNGIGGIPSIARLVDDAEAITDMYRDMYCAVSRIAA